MASKYLQKYPVPAGFQEILHDFTREVLRDQPPNIIEYAAKYFEMLEKGKKFEYESKFNVKKDERKNQMQYNPKAAEDITKKATAAVTKINAEPQPPKKVETKMTPIGGAEASAGPSIKHISQHDHPHDHPISTNTLIKETGHNYVNDLSKKVGDDEPHVHHDSHEHHAHEHHDHDHHEHEHEPAHAHHEAEHEHHDQAQQHEEHEQGEQQEQHEHQGEHGEAAPDGEEGEQLEGGLFDE